MKSVLYIILAALLSTGTALAQDDQVDFDRHDTNGDGYLSSEEWSDVDYVVADFYAIDTDRDGRLSRDEVSSGTQQSGVQQSSQSDTSASAQESSAETIGLGRDEDETGGGATGATVSGSADDAGMETTATSGGDMTTTGTASEDQGATESAAAGSASGSMSATSGTPSGDAQAGQSFQSADADRDNRVSREEAQGSGYDYMVIYFDTLDANRDSYLDENEWRQGEQMNMQEESRVGADEEELYLDGEDDAGFDSAAYEGDNGREAFRSDFESYDADGDGFLTEDEATGDWVDINLFERSDVNDDGLIDIGEAEDGFMEWGDEEEELEDVEYGEDY